ncbi:hypothetical protein JT358_02855 [Micrococcales bacterium 31B]|nr:hypothetical protein [Micrococcales bacterium 31B]
MTLTATIPGHGNFTITPKALQGIEACGGALHCAVDASGCRQHGVTFSPRKNARGITVVVTSAPASAKADKASKAAKAASTADEKAVKKARKKLRKANQKLDHPCSKRRKKAAKQVKRLERKLRALKRHGDKAVDATAYTLTVTTPLAEVLDGALLDFESKGKKPRFVWQNLDVPRNRRCGCGRSFGAPLGKRGSCMKRSGEDCAACPMKALRRV